MKLQNTQKFSSISNETTKTPIKQASPHTLVTPAYLSQIAYSLATLIILKHNAQSGANNSMLINTSNL